jgi:hypothetical protein
MAVILKERGMIAVELEAVKGTAETPDAADAGIEVFDPEVDEDIPIARRNSVEASFDKRPGISGNQMRTVTFRVPMKGSGVAGTVTEITKLLQACGLTETVNIGVDVLYDPESDDAVNQSATIDVYQDKLRKRTHGCMGNVKFVIAQNEVPVMEFTYIGLYNAASDVPLLTGISYGTVSPPNPVGMTCTWAGFTFRLTNFSLDLGNDVQLREDICAATGFLHAYIADRLPVIEVDPEEELVATVDWVEQMRTATLGALLITIGGTAGNVWTFNAPNAQIVDSTPGDRNLMQIKQLVLEALANTDDGDDSVNLTLT